jgi:tetratricopeptide (TPR) repeat protein
VAAPAPPPKAPVAAPLEPKGAPANIAVGNKLLARRPREAQKFFERALVEQPGSVEAKLGLGLCLLYTERYGAATDRLKEVLAAQPGNGEAIFGLGQAYKMRGDKARAVEYYKKYLAEQPSGARARLARTYLESLEAGGSP